MNKLPTAFIGCIEAQKDIAEAIQANLQGIFEIEIWNQGTFILSRSNIGNLIDSGRRFDFAILILTPDDPYNDKALVPRDNVILEIGFFIGLLGIERTFLICQKEEKLKLPTDLNGIVIARYERPLRISLRGALGGACTLIREAASKVLGLDFQTPENTPGNVWTANLVRSALKVVCRVFESPLPNLDAAKLRAFIFKKEESSLICTHFWALSKTKESVGVLKFEIDDKTSKQVAVVQAAICKKTVAVKVEPLEGIDVLVEDNLCFVLAAPIIGPNGDVWGTVDIDACSKEGEQLLNNSRAKEAIFELGRHLYLALTSKEKK